MAPGYYRVHLKTKDEKNWLTIFVPLDSTGLYDASKPKPHVFKAIWEGDEYCGELIMNKGGQNFLRDYGGPDNLTDFLKVPITLERVYRFHENNLSQSQSWEFTVKALDRM